MKTLYAPFDDGLYFDIGWEIDVLTYWPQDTAAILEIYLNHPQTHGKSTSVDSEGTKTICDLHGPFSVLPSKNDYTKVTQVEFERIVTAAINKQKQISATEEETSQLNAFLQSILEEVRGNDKLNGSDIYFLNWSYDFDSRPRQHNLVKFYHYMEFVFVNLVTRKIYKAILGAE